MIRFEINLDEANTEIKFRFCVCDYFLLNIFK